jgi:hypothetical protein
MKRSTFPGFTAEVSLYKTGGCCHVTGILAQVDATVHPASCLDECFQDCMRAGGLSKSACMTSCRTECGLDGGGGDGGSGGGGGTGGAGCSQLFPSGSGLPIYGNYCGPGHGNPTGLTPPVDAVDAVCRAHDLCYAGTNMFNCGCDRALITSMPAAILATPCPTGKTAGAAAMAYFASSPCVCNTTVCLPLLGCGTVAVPGLGGVGVC